MLDLTVTMQTKLRTKRCINQRRRPSPRGRERATLLPTSMVRFRAGTCSSPSVDRNWWCCRYRRALAPLARQHLRGHACTGTSGASGCRLTTCTAPAVFSSHSINSVNKKNITSNISTYAWSTKWSLFIIFFIWMGCKSRDKSNEHT